MLVGYSIIHQLLVLKRQLGEREGEKRCRDPQRSWFAFFRIDLVFLLRGCPAFRIANRHVIVADSCLALISLRLHMRCCASYFSFKIDD